MLNIRTKTFLRFFSLSVFSAFILGYIILFSIHPHLKYEIHNIGIASFNLKGISYQPLIALVNYFLPGFLISCFGIALIYLNRITVIRIGSFSILLSGVMWMAISFYQLQLDGFFSIFSLFQITHLGICWFTGILGVILIGSNYKPVMKPRFTRIYSATIASLMILEGIYLLYSDYNGYLTAIAWFLYFSWFFVFGLQIIRSKYEN